MSFCTYSSNDVPLNIWAILISHISQLPRLCSFLCAQKNVCACHLPLLLMLTTTLRSQIDFHLDEQHIQMLGRSSYAAPPAFLASHEWVANGSSDILSTTAAANSVNPNDSPTAAKICVVSQVLLNPHLLKLKNLGNFNDRYMSMYNAKWVVHLGRPTGTVYEQDWLLALNNILALQERIAASQGINMLVYTPQNTLKDLRTSAACFLANVCSLNLERNCHLLTDSDCIAVKLG